MYETLHKLLCVSINFELLSNVCAVINVGNYVCVAAFTTRVATVRIKAQTVVTLAPFNTNLTTHDHKTVVQLQTHVRLFHCFIRLFVNKTWWRQATQRGRETRPRC